MAEKDQALNDTKSEVSPEALRQMLSEDFSKSVREMFNAVLLAMDHDANLSAKYMATRIEALHDKCDRLVTSVADLDAKVHGLEDRINKASDAFRELREEVTSKQAE